jgi:hypothetical protein
MIKVFVDIASSTHSQPKIAKNPAKYNFKAAVSGSFCFYIEKSVRLGLFE